MRPSLAWVLVGALASPAVIAQPAEGDAQTLIDRATEDFRAGRYDASMALFEEAHRKTADKRLLYMIGRCHEELGELPEAIAAFERFLVGEAPPDAREKALDHIRAVRERMAKGTLRVEVQPAFGQVLVDGVVVGTGPTVELEVQAGERTVQVRAGGYVATTRQVDVPGSGSAVVAVTLAPVAAEVQTPMIGVGAREEDGPGLSTWGWGLLGGGAALLIGGAVTYGLGEEDHRAIVDAEGYGTGEVVHITRARALELEQRGDDLKTGGAILWGVGGAALVGAVTLLILDATAEPPPVSVGAGPSADGAGLWLTGSF